MTLLTRIRAHLWVTPMQLSTSARKTRVLIRERADRLEALMATVAEQLAAALAGIRADLDAFKAAVAALSAQVATLEGGQAAAVQAAVAEVEAQFQGIADQFTALDAENPEAPVEPPVV